MPVDSKKRTIAVDLDATLAYYEEWESPTKIGKPIKPMVDRVKAWLADGCKVWIFTARMANTETREAVEKAIGDWTLEHIGERLPVTATKLYSFSEIWDDRARRVKPNTGIEM